MQNAARSGDNEIGFSFVSIPKNEKIMQEISQCYGNDVTVTRRRFRA